MQMKTFKKKTRPQAKGMQKMKAMNPALQHLIQDEWCQTGPSLREAMAWEAPPAGADGNGAVARDELRGLVGALDRQHIRSHVLSVPVG